MNFLNALLAFFFGLLTSLLSGWYLRKNGAQFQHDGARMVKKVLAAFYLRLLVDGLVLYLSYQMFHETVPVLLTATGLLIGMVWSVWPLIRRHKEGGARQ